MKLHVIHILDKFTNHLQDTLIIEMYHKAELLIKCNSSSLSDLFAEALSFKFRNKSEKNGIYFDFFTSGIGGVVERVVGVNAF